MKTGKKRPMGVLAFMWRHSEGVRGWFALALLCALVGILSGFLMPQVIRFTVDGLLGQSDTSLPAFLQQWLRKGDIMATLNFCAGATIALALLNGFGTFASRLSVATSTERFCKALRDKLFRHVQYLPFSWHVATNTGDTIQRCTADLDAVRNFMAVHLLEVIRTALLVSVALGLMFSMNLTLTLVALVFIPVIALYTTIFYRLVGKRFLAADEAEGVLTGVVQENLTGVRVVRAFGRERFEMDRFDRYNENFAGLWIRLGKILAPYWGIGDIATGLQILSVVVVGAVLAANGQITLGEFLVFVTYNQTLAWPIRALGRTLSEMSKTGVSARRLQEILDAKAEEPEPEAKKPPLATDIRFENVTFAYGQQPVLQDLSFTIPGGSTFGILGATGSGKSTITYLLNRLYDLGPGLGAIYFGDTEIREIDRNYLRRQVGLVLQEPFLFSKTIGENIAITAEMPDWDRVHHSAGVAAVDDAISTFANGYDTVVGERGVTLSGGQKQRVAIARTLMLDAPVMVFDDSMSAVDTDTDQKIREALRREKGRSTVILISHRISTLMQADQILVLEDGKMAALGSHAQLIETPGMYKRIYDTQSACEI